VYETRAPSAWWLTGREFSGWVRKSAKLSCVELTTAMIADGAHVADGKLYILGGQWDRLTVPAFPAAHPSMAVVLVIRVEYTEALETHRLNVELVLDGKQQGVRATGELATGHAPTQARGAPSFVSLALPFSNVAFEAPGRHEWVVTIDEHEVGRLPIDVVQLAMPGRPARPQSPNGG